MHLCSLHPVTVDAARAFLGELDGGRVARLNTVKETSAGYPAALGHAFAAFLAEREPSFVVPGVSLTTWEARVDRGVGMLLRPPSRLFVEAGMGRGAASRLPIRLDAGGGRMAGAYVPAPLVPQLQALLTERLERQARRLAEAEIEPVGVLGLMLEAVGYAVSNGVGLIEALDVYGDAEMRGGVVVADARRVDKALRRRIEEAAKPPKEPGVIGRMLRRGRASGGASEAEGGRP